MSGVCARGIRDLFKISRSHVRLLMRHQSDYQKASISILNNDEEGATFIDSYSVLGFRLSNNIKIIGPMAVFPRSVLHWNVSSAEDINEDSLSLFTLLEPKIEILIIGKGEDSAQVSPSVIQYLRSKKINVEILNTENACSTFNFLNSEKRYVAAAMIPPQFMHTFSAAAQLELQEDTNIYNLETNYTDAEPYQSDEFLKGVPEKWRELMAKSNQDDFPDETYKDEERDERIASERVRLLEEMKDRERVEAHKDEIRIESKIKEERERILADVQKKDKPDKD